MRNLFLLWLVAPWLGAGAVPEIVPSGPPVVALGGEVNRLEIRLRNRSKESWTGHPSVRLWQTASTMAMPVSERQTLHELTVPAGQTVIDWVPLRFPSVRAETRFLAEWFLDDLRQSPATKVQVLPSDALKELASLAGDRGMGLFDPLDRLKPLLEHAGTDFVTLDEEGLPQFRGTLLLAATGTLERAEASRLKRALRKPLAAGVHILWFRQPDPEATAAPIICWHGPDQGTLVVAETFPLAVSEWTAADQQRVLVLARLALAPEKHGPLSDTDPVVDL
ncbi:MAG TPA: hypothetical protein PK640_04365 [Verrucomicrobiota bacterium]|nr:hypothetical protein [Verrucomicrobiota bacterium]